jgi:hypothetical protein
MLIPFRSRHRHSQSSNAPSDDPLSERSAWLRLTNKLQVLAGRAPGVGPDLERIVDGVLEELTDSETR